MSKTIRDVQEYTPGGDVVLGEFFLIIFSISFVEAK